MRVLQVSNFYPPYWVGGYEKLAAWVADGLRARGHQVEVLTGRGPAFAGRPEIHAELDIDLSDLWERYFTKGLDQGRGFGAVLGRHVFSHANFKACLRALRRFRPDIVSFWNPAFVTFSPLLACRFAGVPAVAHLCDTTANVFRNPHAPGPSRLFRTAARLGVDLLLKAARPARIIAPSDFLKDKFVTREGLPASRVVVLRGPIEPRMSLTEPPARARDRPLRLLFVGTLVPEKGPHVLVPAFRQALSYRPELTLTIVGGGPEAYVSSLREAAQGLPIRFPGRLEVEGVIDAYETHDVLVFPSIWDEPFAVVPLEAMAMGLAVVATTAGGTPEAIVHEETGLLVPPGDPGALRDALLRLAADPPLVHALASAGQTWARENQAFPVFMKRLTDLYDDVCAMRRGVS